LASDARIGDFVVPKGWLALLSFYSSGRDPQNFSKPLSFAPDRWLRGDNDTEFKAFKPHGTMPFGLGGRSCVGKKIATYQLHSMATKVSASDAACHGN
jgi:ecdysteroid 2-hydroxylase